MLINAREIIRRSFFLYKNNWKAFYPYLILLFIPYALISAMPVFNVLIYSMMKGGSSGFSAQIGLGYALILVVYVSLMILPIWVTIALIRKMDKKYGAVQNHESSTTKQELDNGKKYIWPLIWTSLLSVLIVLGGTILLIVPGIIFGLWYIFASYEVILNEKKGMTALRESKNLVQGRWWGVFWRIFAPGFVFGVISMIFQGIVLFPFSFLTMFQHSLPMTITAIVVATFCTMIMLPFSMAVPLIVYRELKKSKEKTDAEEPAAA